MRRLFLTGASGFLGGHLYLAARRHWQVFATYLQHPPSRITAQWVKLDLTHHVEVREYLEYIRPDVIIHAAAQSNLDLCEESPLLAEAVNVQATINLASYAAHRGIRFIFISSDMVFDGSGQFYEETDAVAPLSVYGRCKVAAENIVRSNGKNWVIARAALIYGRPAIGGTSFSQWIEKRLQTGETVPLFNDQFRTPILADNLAEAVLELAGSDFVGTLHLAGANRIDRFQFGEQLCRISGYNRELLRSISMRSYQPKAPRPADVSLSIKRAQSVLKTRLLTTEEGIERMMSGR